MCMGAPDPPPIVIQPPVTPPPPPEVAKTNTAAPAPAAPIAPAAPTITPSGATTTVSGRPGASAEANGRPGTSRYQRTLARTGTGSLRIDLDKPAAGPTGLNIPQ